MELDYKSLKDNKEMRIKEMRVDEEQQEDGSSKMIISGYACVFNQETMIGDEEWGWLETIDKGAFDETDMKDCCLKYNHGDTKGILARVRNNSLKLSVDEHGLKFVAELIDTTDNIDIYKCVKAGLLDKCSFAFTVSKEEIDESVRPIKRTIKKIAKLWDCAVVDVPAYDGTEVYARSKEIVGERLKYKSLENDRKALENALEIEKLKARIKGGKF